MGTAVVRYQPASGHAAWGVLKGDAIHPLSINYAHQAELIGHYFDDRSGFDQSLSDTPIAGDVTFLAPLSQRTQVFAQGLNYGDHREESGLQEEGAENLIFAKPGSTICGPDDDIIKPQNVALLDYEIELGLILKQAVTAPVVVSDGDLGDYIGALILCNDVSARDEMFGAPMLQWFKGKGYRTFCPSGPVLYLMDNPDFDQLYDLDLTLKLNGEVRQQARTSQLIHRPPKTVSDISIFADMQQGDVILTGTPGGVIAGHSTKAGLAIAMNLTNDQKRRKKFVAAQEAQATFLKAGDKLELHIASRDGSLDLGTQTNRIVDG